MSMLKQHGKKRQIHEFHDKKNNKRQQLGLYYFVFDQ